MSISFQLPSLNWLLKTEEQIQLLALEMDYLRRSARVSRIQNIPNTGIRNKIQPEQSIIYIYTFILYLYLYEGELSFVSTSTMLHQTRYGMQPVRRYILTSCIHTLQAVYPFCDAVFILVRAFKMCCSNFIFRAE